MWLRRFWGVERRGFEPRATAAGVGAEVEVPELGVEWSLVCEACEEDSDALLGVWLSRLGDNSRLLCRCSC
jgi:hypothetical protein